MPPPPAVKPTPLEIQEAHDVLWAVVNDEVDLSLTEDMRNPIHAALDTTCWILGHAHSTAFQRNLTALKDAAIMAGYVLVDAGELKDAAS